MEFINRNPKIIVLSGKAQSGKSLVSSIVKDCYSEKNIKCVVLGFADCLKEYAKLVLGWDGSSDTKPRDFLQQIGVELIKNQIDSNMLINRVIQDIKVYSYFFDIIVISDARFVDEIESIKNNFSNVFVIHIEGRDNSLTEDQKMHLTEVGLDNYDDYDFVINNNGDKLCLIDSVCNILEVI